jgi:nitroreductase
MGATVGTSIGPELTLLLPRHDRHARDYGHAVTALDLTPDQLLTTTRAVRKRLDFTRPVPDELVRECVAAALQAPSGSNNPSMAFVVVRDEPTRRALGEIYRQCYDIYRTLDGVYIRSIDKGTDDAIAQQERSADSADFLGEHMGEAPVLVVACTTGLRLDGVPAMMAASLLGNILPAMWSFMLAARARGLGTAWTTVHLMQEEAAAGLLGIPFAEVQQVCLSPLAFTMGTEFKPAARPEPDSVIHWDRW